MILNFQEISLVKAYHRIVSLVPSQTELLHDLGLEDEVVGITKFCVHPAGWHRSKARVGGTKQINIASIHHLQPDLLIANKEENVKEQIEELSKSYDVYVTDVCDLRDAINMINTVGLLVGKATEASHIANKIEVSFKELQDLVNLKRKVGAAYLIWKDPFMTVGRQTFINDMMQYCGLDNIFSSKKRYPEISLDELPADCKMILLSSEPYPFKDKHLKEMELKVPRAKTILVDGEMFSWYGSRLLKAARYFRKLLYELADGPFGEPAG